MIFAVYKCRESGKVVKAHDLKTMKDWEEITTAVKLYNKNPNRKDDVEAVQVEDGSLQDFLYRRADVAVRDFTDRLNGIESSIDVLASDIRDLLREAERQRPEGSAE